MQTLDNDGLLALADDIDGGRIAPLDPVLAPCPVPGHYELIASPNLGAIIRRLIAQSTKEHHDDD